MTCLALQRGLTLVELLVVTAVVVVLLALMMTMTTSALNMSKLALCAAGMDSVATGVVQYAVDHRRSYPYRSSLRMMTVLEDAGLRWTSIRGVLQSADHTQRLDDRPPIKPYMSLRNLLDPFCDAIDLDDRGTAERNDTWVFAPYEMWCDFQYDGFSRMSRLGDGFSWRNPDTGKLHRWRVLVGDMNTVRGSVDAVLSSHNDRDSRLVQDTELGTYAYADGTRDYHSFYTNSGPWSAGDRRGPQDYNYAYDDGSVRPMRGVRAIAWGPAMDGPGVRISRLGLTVGPQSGADLSDLGENLALAPWAPWEPTEWRPSRDGDYVVLPADER
jgi:prepilin-type N-terminal cleavage/methylation domain-containing protein